MSRLTDLQGVLRGLGKIGSCSCQTNVRDFKNIYENTFIKPVVQQAVKIVLDIKDPVHVAQNKSKLKTESIRERNKGLSLQKSVENIPLVLEGMGIFANIIMTGNAAVKSPTNSLGTINDTESKPKVLNSEVSSLDLLEYDLTNQQLLREKIFIKPEDLPDNSVKPVAAAEPPRTEPPPVVELPSSGVDTKLSSAARERRVPSSRVSRVASFASLGVGLGLGVMAEASRRAVGVSQSSSSLVLNEANAERMVSTLCRVRGAALKLGQILSIQDGSVVGPEVQRIFDRVRESADFMPEWQLERVMVGELGQDWREKFKHFQAKPIAAASIGQVHYAQLHDGSEVAVKVQYPGVARSIDSDIRNLLSLVSVMAVLPEGLFLDKIGRHMKQELAEECDYRREADCGSKMKSVLAGYPEYHVPAVFPGLSSGQVLTTEYLTGLTIDRCLTLPQHTRNFIAESILKLVFRELFLHRLMQTDPNWANFLFNPKTNKIGLLDFGATREFRPGFVNTYFNIINSAVEKDREAVLEYSREIGFLTGYESRTMNEAHVDSVMLLARPFHENVKFSFGEQTITQEIQEKTGVMIRERLCPPPPEVYSLHRKLSGLFLLAGKLESEFNCFVIWRDIRARFRPFQEE